MKSLRPIAAALVSILGALPLESLGAPAVTNCNDSGPGSLRQSVLDASLSDSIDLTQLQCTTITLTTGAIAIGQNYIGINGPGSDKLTIDGSQNPSGSGIFVHTGSGVLQIYNLAVRHGSLYLNDENKYFGGGCIGSTGSVELNGTIVSDCTVTTGTLSRAQGGAVFAQNYIKVLNSVISNNNVYGPPTDVGRGGGLFAHGNVDVFLSTIENNKAHVVPGTDRFNLDGGGIYAKGNVTVYYSTISGNAAATGAAITGTGSNLHIFASTISGNRGYFQGAVVATQGVTTSIVNSTISGNTAASPAELFSGTPALTLFGPTTISNSTIAFNVANGSKAAVSIYSGQTLKMYSSIIADNFPADVYRYATSSLGGSYNLIVNSSLPVLPNTITSCPQLEPLADNGGGRTRTHALRQSSPAIDAGLNLMGLAYDQRGGGYPRKFGSRPDMGAFEWQGGPDDAIFHSGFDFPSGFCELH